MYNIVEMIGFLAASLGVISFLPQVFKIWKSRSAESISSLMYIIYCTSVALWLTYGIMIKSPPLIIANSLVFVLAFSILVMKFLWK